MMRRACLLDVRVQETTCTPQGSGDDNPHPLTLRPGGACRLIRERIFIKLMTSDSKLRRPERAQNEGSTGLKRLDDTRCTTYQRRINYSADPAAVYFTLGFLDARVEETTHTPRPGGNPRAKSYFLRSTPIQMLPRRGSICGRLT